MISQDKLVVKFNPNEKAKFSLFLTKYKKYKLYDYFDSFSFQYLIIKDPSKYFLSEVLKKKLEIKSVSKTGKWNGFSKGNWVVLPAQKIIYHILEKEQFLDLRTIRNRDLITLDEQKILYNKKILFIGMSVGSQVITTFLRTGIGNNFTVIDGDTVDIHNMNRTNYSLLNVGRKKVEVIKEQLLNVDPYIEISSKSDYLTPENIESIVANHDLIVDCFDNFVVKILLRKIAKKLKIPVISGFDVSRGAMVIVERYDIDKKLDLSFYLNGFTEEIFLSMKNKNIQDKTKMFIRIIGKKYHDTKMLNSVMRVGKDLTGFPQLVIATTLAAAMWTTAAQDLFLGKSKRSIRKYVNLESLLYK